MPSTQHAYQYSDTPGRPRYPCRRLWVSPPLPNSQYPGLLCLLSPAIPKRFTGGPVGPLHFVDMAEEEGGQQVGLLSTFWEVSNE